MSFTSLDLTDPSTEDMQMIIMRLCHTHQTISSVGAKICEELPTIEDPEVRITLAAKAATLLMIVHQLGWCLGMNENSVPDACIARQRELDRRMANPSKEI